MDAIPPWVPYTFLSVAVVVLTYFATRRPAPTDVKVEKSPRDSQESPTKIKPPTNPLHQGSSNPNLRYESLPKRSSNPQIQKVIPKKEDPESKEEKPGKSPELTPVQEEITKPIEKISSLEPEQKQPEQEKGQAPVQEESGTPEPKQIETPKEEPQTPKISEKISSPESEQKQPEQEKGQAPVQGESGTPEPKQPQHTETPKEEPKQHEQEKGEPVKEETVLEVSAEPEKSPEQSNQPVEESSSSEPETSIGRLDLVGSHVRPKAARKVDLESLFDQLKELSSGSTRSSGSTSGSSSDSGEESEDTKLDVSDLAAGLTALKNIGETDDTESGSETGSETPESSSSSEESEGKSLVADFAAVEDINKLGLTRAKKYSMVKGKKVIQMEDTNYVASPFAEDPEVSLFCVFDGHGGKTCAEELVTVFPKVFTKKWAELDNPKHSTDFTEFWKALYQEVDQELKLNEECSFCGATCTTVLVWKAEDGNKYLQSANVGDSSAFLLQDEKSVMLSVDHKVTNEDERARMVASGVNLTPNQTRLTGGLALCRALGDHFLKDEEKNTGLIAIPYVSKPVQITKGCKRFVVASDGLWDIVPGRNVFTLLTPQMTAEEAAKKLLTTATSSTQCDDNVTVIVVNL